MGVVYKAEDVRLKRTVALKFLPSQQGVSEVDKERFLREAQAAAALDHANICTVYEIDEADGKLFMAMAFVEGAPLDTRIGQGPLPLGEALEIVSQAAEGLRAAHEKGVVHRDIKSSNLMVSGNAGRPQVKILDFGLAQLTGRSKITQAQTQLGTVAYMSPEQTQGEAVDHRTDVWSLGVVLYEMVSGELPFKGHYDQATLYSILNEEPEPLTAIRSRVPVELDWIVDKCLAKSADERYQSVDDLLLDITTLQKKLSSERLSIHRTQIKPLDRDSNKTIAAPMPVSAPDPTLEKKVHTLWWVVALLAILATGELVWALYASRSGEVAVLESPVRRFDINLPRALPPGTQLRQLAISPDGRRLAFVTNQIDGRLWVRDLGQAVAWPLEGSEGAQAVFWSPDGQTIGYVAQREMRKVAAQGGPPTTLATLSGALAFGATWSPDGDRIFFVDGPPFGLYEVSALGGAPKEVLAEEGGRRRGVPVDLQAVVDSSGKTLLLGVGRGRVTEQVVLLDPETGDRTPIVAGGSAFYAASGYLFYQPSRTPEIWAMPFSLDERAPTGDPFPVAQAGRRPSVSSDGTLVFMDDALTGGPRRVTVRDRAGELTMEIGGPQVGIRWPRFSPDGRHVAVSAIDASGSDIWIHSEGETQNRRLTREPGNDANPIWSPDGSMIVYATNEDGVGSILLRPSAGAGSAKTIFTAPGSYNPIDWSADGETIVVRERSAGRSGISYLRPNASGEYAMQPFIEGVFGANSASLSPNGKYIVYGVREDGEPRIYVQEFPKGDGQWVISSEPSGAPRWSPAGDEIFFVQGNDLVALPVKTRGEFSAGQPQKLFSHPSLSSDPRSPSYDVSPDGQRFALVEIVGEPPPPTIRVVLNWLTDFKR